jgi:hypothetical protein
MTNMCCHFLFVLFACYPIPSQITYMCVGVAAEIDESSQIKYRVQNTRGVQALKNKLKTTQSNRLFRNTNKTAKQEQDT